MQLVVHEATIVSFDRKEAMDKRHSTPRMAGEFAAAVNARRLLLTHFTPSWLPFETTSSIHYLGLHDLIRQTAPLLREVRHRLMTAKVGLGPWREVLDAIEAATVQGWSPTAQRAVPIEGPASGCDAWDGSADLDGVAADAGPEAARAAARMGTVFRRLSSARNDPRVLIHGLLETHRARRLASGSWEAVESTVEQNVERMLRTPREPALQSELLSRYSYPRVQDPTGAQVLVDDARRAFPREEVLCARDWLAVNIPLQSTGLGASCPKPKSPRERRPTKADYRRGNVSGGTAARARADHIGPFPRRTHDGPREGPGPAPISRAAPALPSTAELAAATPHLR